MTTYNTYQEAKIAMPLACIIHDTDDDIFFGMPSREGTTLNDDGCKFAEPHDYCMTVEKFLADGNKFVEGDVYQNEDGRVFTVGNLGYEARYCNLLSSYCFPSKIFILRAAVLENQMNIDNLATQTPEEKEALDLIDTTPHQYEMSKFSGEGEWKNGDVVYDSDGNEITIINTGMIYGLDNTGTYDYWDCEDLCKTKPETKKAKEKREWIEKFAHKVKHVGTMTYKDILGEMYDSLKGESK